MDAGQQLGEVERLRDVVVGTALEAAHPRLQFILCREQQDRCRHPALAQLGDDTETVAPRQHHIEDNAAEAALEGAFKGAITGIRLGDAVAFLAERFAQKATQIAIIFNEKDLHEANVRPAARRGQCEKDEKALRMDPRHFPANGCSVIISP